MSHLPELYKLVYFTTARIIHHPEAENDSEDWLWVNGAGSWHFGTEDEAQSHANLSNDNGRESGIDVNGYPYFVVRVEQSSLVERVQ